MPDGAHPLPPFRPDMELIGYMEQGQKKGWESLPFVDADGDNWPVSFAAKMLDIPEGDLKDLIRMTGLQPAGVIRMAGFKRQGRQPRAYPADKLILLAEAIQDLRESIEQDLSDSG